MDQETPRKAPRGIKLVSSGAQEVASWAQQAPKSDQVRPESAQAHPKKSPRDFKLSPKGVEEGPKGCQIAVQEHLDCNKARTSKFDDSMTGWRGVQVALGDQFAGPSEGQVTLGEQLNAT